MIITLTMNPALDKTVKTKYLKPGELNRVERVSLSPGGKGINVARVLHKIGYDVIAMGIVGGDTGQKIDDLLKEEGIRRNFTWSKKPTRENLKIIGIEEKRETEINEKGLVLPEDYHVLLNALEVELEKAQILVISGSLPEGIPQEAYREIIELAHDYDVKTILDSSGKPLELALIAKPHIVKPNLQEAETLLGHKVHTEEDLMATVDFFINRDIETLALSLGDEGAIFAREKEMILVEPPEVEIKRTTVGAGDALVAALTGALSAEKEFRQQATEAVAVATAYVQAGDINNINFEKIADIESELKISILRRE